MIRGIVNAASAFFFVAFVMFTLAVGALVPTTAYAVTLTATSTVPEVIGSFTVTFNDADADGLLSLDEVTGFSGVSCTLCAAAFYSTLSEVPDILGIADGGGASWRFDTPTETIGIDPSVWTYAIGQTPLPATLPLLAGGVGALGLLISRKRRR